MRELPERQVRALLVTPPLTDPTTPYHSLSYLTGAARAAGHFGVECIDANVDALNYLAESARVDDLVSQCAAIREDLECHPTLSRGEQLLYREALAAVGMDSGDVTEAIGIFRDERQFYDHTSYRRAVKTVRRWFRALGAIGLPGSFDGPELTIHGRINLSSIADLTNRSAQEALLRPFAPYLDGPLRHELQQEWHVVGISVNYVSQLPFAVDLARRARRESGGALVCLGGTEISDVVKYLRDPADVWKLFPEADLLVVGEGESAFVELLDAVAAGEQIPAGPGLMRRDDRRMPPVRYENLATLPPPAYDVTLRSHYWSPEPVLLYSPTRGCYWNKCTFCDYGLNTDTPTSPSRERPAILLAEDLRILAKSTRTVYLAVDAMSPRFLRTFAETASAVGPELRWSAELRLERTLARGLAERLRTAGAVALSFGYESGSQRVLDLIDKGVRLDAVPDVLTTLRDAGVGAQMMGFLGFPGETATEASQTYQFLLGTSGSWTLAGIGDFTLTPGAIVARRPAAFGIMRVDPYEGDDIIRAMSWTDREGERHVPGDARTAEVDVLARQLPRPTLDDRPWVGGIDSAHSILYFARYGPSLLPSDVPSSASPETGTRQITPFPGVGLFPDAGDLLELHRSARREGRALNFSELEEQLAVHDAVGQAGPQTTVEVFPSGDCIVAEDDEGFSPAYHLLKARLLESYGVG